MKTNRLSILVAAMLLLAVLRFAFPSGEAQVATVEAIVRPAVSPGSLPASAAARVAESASAGEGDVPGNAFAVRVVAPPPPPPPLPVVNPTPALALQTAPVQPAPPPPPPLQVIGTYDDGAASAVFLSTPSGTLIARAGSVLLAEYRVTGITAQHVTLMQESTQRTFQIPVPGSAPR